MDGRRGWFSFRRAPVRPPNGLPVGFRSTSLKVSTWRAVKGFVVGAVLMQFLFWALTSGAASPAGVCKVTWSNYVYLNIGEWTEDWTEYQCSGGSVVVSDNGTCGQSGGTCFCNGTGGAGSRTGNPPNGFTCGYVTPGDYGTCSCGNCGTCDYYGYSNGTVGAMGNNCYGTCACPDQSSVSWQNGSFSLPCVQPTCSGTCNYNVVDNGDGSYGWVLYGSSCTAGLTGCSCPTDPGGPCPTHAVDQTSVACGATGGTCTRTCSGNCSYTSIDDGTGGFRWSLQGNTCTAGAANCSCPASPSGPCPTAAGMTTTLACGSAGGTCVPNCSGSCNYTSGGTDTGGYLWLLTSNNCTAGAQNCQCPSDPGGTCPSAAGQTKSVACGASSSPCQQPPCFGHGGDQDGDGCCHDVDCDDADRMVCANCCKGTCTWQWQVQACAQSSMTYRWDGEAWKWESGDCGACSFNEPTTPGEADGQTINVPCNMNLNKGTWVKIASNCNITGTEVGKCGCGVMPSSPGQSDGATVDVACDEHCQANGGDADSDGCCADKDLDDTKASPICGCECMYDPYSLVTQFNRRLNRLPILKLIRDIRGQTAGGSYDGVLQLPLPIDGQTLSINVRNGTFSGLASTVRAVSLLLGVYFICLRLITVFKT